MASTPLLGLSLPADGTTNWGTLVNTSITALLDSAVAGTTTLTTDADAILSATAEATNEARQAIILWNATGTVTRNITAPAQSKTYVVINATGGTQSIIFRGSGSPPTTGVTIPAGKAYMLAWKGTDFVTIGVTSVNLATDVSGTLGVGNGGTGQTTYTDGQLLIGNSTGNTLTKATLSTSGTGLSVTNGAGSITLQNTAPDQTVALTAGTGISTSGTYPNFTVTNTAPDQTVTLSGGGTTTVTGTYPNFVITSGSTTYSTATATVSGLIKLGDDAVQATAANSVSSTSSRSYAVQLNSSGQALVNVPWTDTTYSPATASVAGLIKLGDATVQTTAANTVSNTAARTYAVQVNTSGQGVVNVPWVSSTTSPEGLEHRFSITVGAPSQGLQILLLMVNG